MKTTLSKLLCVLLMTCLVLSCEKSKPFDDNTGGQGKEKPGGELPEEPGDAPLVNQFIMAYVQDGYLWNHLIPTGIDIKNEPDPFDLFDKLLNKNLDRWSYLTDQAVTMFDEYEGVSTTYGYRLTVFRFDGSEQCFAVVRFVYPDSPAEKAGIERGDILFLMNGSPITTSNYMDLYYSPAMTVQTGVLTGNMISEGTKIVSMQAVNMYLDPVNEYTIIDKGGSKIGYLCYTDYITSSHNKLIEVFGYFKSSGVTDVVLDLRYNPGGAVETTQFLSSILAPADAVAKESVFLHELWNEDYMNYFRTNGHDTNQYFLRNIQVNMNLDHIYILTTEDTASASEATIAGLSPYINVVQIGETTHGKYCGAALLQAEDNKGNIIKELENWAMSLIVFKFANADGFTDFVDGLTPSIYMEDDWATYGPLGDESDPGLARAISIITGEPMPEIRSVHDVPGTALPKHQQPDARRGGMVKPIKM